MIALSFTPETSQNLHPALYLPTRDPKVSKNLFHFRRRGLHERLDPPFRLVIRIPRLPDGPYITVELEYHHK